MTNLDRVIMPSLPIRDLDIMCSLNNHFREELGISSNQLTGHAGLCSVDQTILTEIINLRS